MEKRGFSSHLEMILSFGIFFFFVLFLLFYIKPYQDTPLQDSVIIGLHDLFEKNNSVSLTQIFLRADVSSIGCFSVDIPGYNGSSIVKMVDGTAVDSYYSGGTLTVTSGSGNYYILISPEFSSGTLCSGAVAPDGFSIGSITQKNLISHSALENFNQSYHYNYQSVKQNLKVPDNMDFTVWSSDGEFNLTKVPPEKVEVVAKTFSQDVLYDNGSIITKDFIFEAW